VLDMTNDDWRWVLEVNLWGAINGIHTFLPDLVASGGHIINTASGAGLVPAWANAAYCASKYGLVGLSEVMRKELAEDAPGVAISVVFPTATATRIVDSDRLFPADLERRPPTEAETSRLAVKRERLAAGMDPRDVATKVWSAVVDRRFWVFPWAGTADWAMERALEIKDAADRQ
jgi:NAD(P)-dependent dehydrogenase (short-subunit alcohol dehydrogenase family)